MNLNQEKNSSMDTYNTAFSLNSKKIGLSQAQMWKAPSSDNAISEMCSP